MKKIALPLAVAGLTMLGLLRTTMAYPLKYGPFSERELPKPFRLEDCGTSWSPTNAVAGANRKVAFFPLPTGGSGVRVILSDGNDPQHTLISVSGSATATQTFNSCFFTPGIEAKTGDLNGDNLPDFVVFMWSGGCGLMASYADVLFVLSSDQGYTVKSLPTYEPGNRDFVDLQGDGRCQFIQSTFIYGEVGRDGKKHNYWVHRLFQVKGQDVLPADSIDARFPNWVWYTDKPNHKPTTQLTDEQKRRLWAEHARDIQRK